MMYGFGDDRAPLAETLASACAEHTVALVTYRERCPEREADFRALCERKHGLLVEELARGVVEACAPAEPQDPDATGRLVALRLWPRQGA